MRADTRSRSPNEKLMSHLRGGRCVKRYLLMLSACLFAPAVTVAGPAFENGGSLIAACDAPNLSQHWYCLGYVASITDLHVESGQVCLPPGTGKDDLKRVVMSYLVANPVTAREPASTGVLYAIMDAYSCE